MRHTLAQSGKRWVSASDENFVIPTEATRLFPAHALLFLASKKIPEGVRRVA